MQCLECDQCGKKYYTDDVTQRLEAIVNAAKRAYAGGCCH